MNEHEALSSAALSFSTLPLAAQTPSLEQTVRQDFEKEGRKVQWLRSFKGRLDDLNDIAIALAADANGCSGKMQYLRSKEIFSLKGDWVLDEFLLQERDSADNLTATLEGNVSEYVLQATWRNADNTLSKKALLVEVSKTDDIPTHCGDNKWIGKYASPSGDIELLLQKGANNQIWGIAYFQNRSFKVLGAIDEKLRLNLTLKKSGGNLLGTMSGDFSNVKSFEVAYEQPDKNQQKLRFQLKEQFLVDCMEFADYVYSYDVTFPKTKNAAFNTWMQGKADAWLKNWQEQGKKYDLVGRTPQRRASSSASGWCELEFISEQVISGFFTNQTTWGAHQQGMALNFDLKKGEEIRQKDLFKDSFVPSQYVKTVVKTAFKNHALYESDKDFRQWIEAAAFPHFTIRKEGICFSTDFNILYGRQSLTVPYAELKQYLKEGSVVKDIK